MFAIQSYTARKISPSFLIRVFLYSAFSSKPLLVSLSSQNDSNYTEQNLHENSSVQKLVSILDTLSKTPKNMNPDQKNSSESKTFMKRLYSPVDSDLVSILQRFQDSRSNIVTNKYHERIVSERTVEGFYQSVKKILLSDLNFVDWVTELHVLEDGNNNAKSKELAEIVSNLNFTEELALKTMEDLVLSVKSTPGFLNFLSKDDLIAMINKILELKQPNLGLIDYKNLLFALSIHAPFTPPPLPSTKSKKVIIPYETEWDLFPPLPERSAETPDIVASTALILYKSLKANGITPNAEIYGTLFRMFKDSMKGLWTMYTHVRELMQKFAPKDMSRSGDSDKHVKLARIYCTEVSTMSLLASLSRGKSRIFSPDRVIEIWWDYVHTFSLLKYYNVTLLIAFLECCISAAKHSLRWKNYDQLKKIEEVVESIHIKLRCMGLFHRNVSTVGVKWIEETGPSEELRTIKVEDVVTTLDKLINVYAVFGGIGDKKGQTKCRDDGWCEMVDGLLAHKKKLGLPVTDENLKALIHVFQDISLPDWEPYSETKYLIGKHRNYFPAPILPPLGATSEQQKYLDNVKARFEIISQHCNLISSHDDESIRIWCLTSVQLGIAGDIRRITLIVRNEFKKTYSDMFNYCVNNSEELLKLSDTDEWATTVERASKFAKSYLKSVNENKSTFAFNKPPSVQNSNSLITMKSFYKILQSHSSVRLPVQDYLRHAYNNAIQVRLILDEISGIRECALVVKQAQGDAGISDTQDKETKYKPQRFRVDDDLNEGVHMPSLEVLSIIMKVHGAALLTCLPDTKKWFCEKVLQFKDNIPMVDPYSNLSRAERFSIMGVAGWDSLSEKYKDVTPEPIEIDKNIPFELKRLRNIWKNKFKEEIQPLYSELKEKRELLVEIELEKIENQQSGRVTRQKHKNIKPLVKDRLTRLERATKLTRLKNEIRDLEAQMKELFGFTLPPKTKTIGTFMYAGLLSKNNLTGISGPLGILYKNFARGWNNSIRNMKSQIPETSETAGWISELNIRLEEILKDFEDLERKAVMKVLLAEFGGSEKGIEFELSKLETQKKREDQQIEKNKNSKKTIFAGKKTPVKSTDDEDFELLDGFEEDDYINLK
ncbi:hypothetical protein HK096_001174 [Nowakowskiella sp. JEL0078]|nr:hypothetical protein HK096_001174 [Nowakowskiella sp. JEL0078]